VPVLIGVGPKNIAIALPGGQYPMSPTFTSWEDGQRFALHRANRKVQHVKLICQ